MHSETIRLNLNVSSELNESLERIAKKSHTTKSDVIRRALALILAASEAKERGEALGFIDRKNKRVVREIVGV